MICCARGVYSSEVAEVAELGSFTEVGSTSDIISTGVPGVATEMNPRGQSGPCRSLYIEFAIYGLLSLY
jgi:hypothetical protein